MTLEAGTKLGPYEVTAPIGAGGMGEVYRARDTKLNRDVALKVLPEAFANDPERLARFQREAEVLASLNHPNIAHIYGLEDSGDTTAIVLELVEGVTLAHRIAQGRIPLEEALDIARQITEALEAAHAFGIIHRDLKPANIKITPEGVVKVLDFGLAKAFTTEKSADAESSLSPTLTKGTALGVILGTAAYMSPEQAKGKPVDTRTDVWAFGAVLYEMLTGERAFKGEDVSDTLVSVFRDEPDWSKLPGEIPPRVRQAIRVCLHKDAKERVRDITAVRLAMNGAFETTAASSVDESAVVASRSVLSWVAASAMLTALVVALAVWNLKPPEPRAMVRFAHVLPEEESFTFNSFGLPIFSLAPDGSRVVYSANGQLYLRELDEEATQPIPGTVGALNPFFSNDSEWIGFWLGGQFHKAEIGGGAPFSLSVDTSLPVGIDWGEDDTIVYGGNEGVSGLPGSGGTPETLIEGTFLTNPEMLPGGETLLFEIGFGELPRIAVQSLVSGERRELLRGARPRYVPTGHIIFERDGTLFGVGFDVHTLELTGSSVALVEGIDSNGRSQYDISDTGTLAFMEAQDARIAERVLGLASRDGDVELLNVPPLEYMSPRLSPDGRRLAVQSMDTSRHGTVWIYDLSGDRAIQQFTLEGDNRRPLWTPDGKRLTFASDRDGTMSLYWRHADGSGVAERLTTAEDGVSHFPSSWSPDGRTLVYMVHTGTSLQTDWDVWSLSVEDGTATSLYDLADGVHLAPELSPDGRWLAYTSGDRAQSQDVYIEPFPPTGAKRKISQTGAYWPTWSPAGDELFYRPVSGSLERVLNHVDITTEPEFGFSNERRLPVEGFIVVGFYRDYDVSPDGEKLLMVFPAGSKETTSRPSQRIHIVLNWFEELKDRVPN